MLDNIVSIFLVQGVLGIMVLELALYKCKPAITPNAERDAKFPHLARTDYDSFKRWKLYPFAFTFLITRIFLILIPGFIIFFIICRIAGIGLKANGKVPTFQRIVFRVLVYFFSSMLKIGTGCWYTRKKIDFDYSPYLGPNWRKELAARKKPAPTVISNHYSMLDAFVFHTHETFAIVARSNLERVPAVGEFIMGMEGIFVNRLKGKEEVLERATQIVERQEGFEAGKFNNRLFLFPEGMTDNGKFLLPFKRGAFDSLLPVEIWYHLPNSSNVSPAFDCIPQYLLVIFICCNFYNNCTNLHLPQFIPNDYLWETHKDKGKEKW